MKISEMYIYLCENEILYINEFLNRIYKYLDVENEQYYKFDIFKYNFK